MDFSAYVRAIESRRQRNVIAVRETASSHLLGRRIVEEYGRENLRAPAADIVSWSQSAGIGREGRHWSSPAGKGVYLTAVRPLESMDLVQGLPVSISVALGEAVNRWLSPVRESGEPSPVVCRLKWPNDLFVDGRKIGGILIDVLSPSPRRPESAERDGDSETGSKTLASMSSKSSKIVGKPMAVLSVGVNVDRDLEAFDHSAATSVGFETERRELDSISLGVAACELLDALDAGLEAQSEHQIENYRRLSLHRPGDQLECQTGSGTLRGAFLGFDDRGFLRLDVGGEERVITSGIVSDGE